MVTRVTAKWSYRELLLVCLRWKKIVCSATCVTSWYHWRHLKISAGPGQRIAMEIPGYGGSLFQSTSGVKYSNMCTSV